MEHARDEAIHRLRVGMVEGGAVGHFGRRPPYLPRPLCYRRQKCEIPSWSAASTTRSRTWITLWGTGTVWTLKSRGPLKFWTSRSLTLTTSVKACLNWSANKKKKNVTTENFCGRLDFSSSSSVAVATARFLTPEYVDPSGRCMGSHAQVVFQPSATLRAALKRHI